MSSNLLLWIEPGVPLMIEIDGSMGEGGGAVLRTALALGALSGRGVRITNIRAKRPNPGLAHQHLHGVKILAELTDAEVYGAELRSQELLFKPKKTKGGRYRVDIGTAGSTTLILQILMPAAAFADAPVDVEIRGGTNNPFAPPVEYLANVTLPILRRMGYRAELELVRRGHYPHGGGLIHAKIEPVEKLSPLRLTEPGRVARIRGISHCVKLPEHVAIRQAHAAKKILLKAGFSADIETEFYEPERDPHLGPGSGIVLWAETEGGALIGSSSLGKRGKPAEKVGREAAEMLLRQLQTRCAVDRWLTDQLVPYLALADGESEITSAELTSHTLTNVALVEKILNVKFDIQGKLGTPGRMRIAGIGFQRGP